MKLSVADEVWIGTALLHKEHPDRVDFDNQESLSESARKAFLTRTAQVC